MSLLIVVLFAVLTSAMALAPMIVDLGDTSSGAIGPGQAGQDGPKIR